MAHHACFGMPFEQLDVVVVEDSKPMQAILRTMLHAIRVRRVRLYDSLKDAVAGILREPPNLVISDWRLGRRTPYRFLKSLRKQSMGPLSLVPVLIVTAHATQGMLDRAIGAGAHTVLVKPLAPAVLHDRIRWLTRDSREMVVGEGGVVMIRGMAERLRAIRSRFPVTLEESQPSIPRLPTDTAPVPTWRLRFGETVKRQGGPKRPEETLKRMPRLNHFAALRLD